MARPRRHGGAAGGRRAICDRVFGLPWRRLRFIRNWRSSVRGTRAATVRRPHALRTHL